MGTTLGQLFSLLFSESAHFQKNVSQGRTHLMFIRGKSVAEDGGVTTERREKTSRTVQRCNETKLKKFPDISKELIQSSAVTRCKNEAKLTAKYHGLSGKIGSNCGSPQGNRPKGKWTGQNFLFNE